MKDSSNFINEIKSLNNLLSNSILVTGDGINLYPSISHESCLNATKEAFGNRESKSIPTEGILKMREFVLVLFWFYYIDDIIFIWTHGEKELIFLYRFLD